MSDQIAQGILPVAAAVVSRNANLPPHESVLYTAAALLSPGLLGIVPALVGSQRAPKVPPQNPVPPKGEMVDIPNVVGKLKDEAKKIVEQCGLRPVIEEVAYKEPKTTDRVIKQVPESDQLLARKGSVVLLLVSLGPTTPPPDPDLERTVAAFKRALLEVEAEKAAQQNPAVQASPGKGAARQQSPAVQNPAAQNPPAPSGSSSSGPGQSTP